MNVFVGTSGYSYPEWKGTFYPAKMPPKQMLGFYAARLGTVEINNTFYRAPTAQLLESWAAQVPAGFRFVLKAPQEITHVKRLRDAGAAVALYEVAGALGDRLGAVLFQLPPNLGADVPRLAAFLAALPARCRAAFEFRHPSWFRDDVYALLRARNAALCLADAGDDLDVPFVPTADWGYVRLRRADYTGPGLAAWAARVKAQKWDEAFVFFKHEDAGTGPRYAAQLIELLDGTAQKRAA
ncbi:MAG: DUF72 domain-containing protein [Planctomycetes bacterium]|nr:DUF72 domain-containing protein [Planctomycetota bacterium]